MLARKAHAVGPLQTSRKLAHQLRLEGGYGSTRKDLETSTASMTSIYRGPTRPLVPFFILHPADSWVG